MIVNILIPSIPERKTKQADLVKELERQISKCNNPKSFNIITHSSKTYSEGGMTIGAKRQYLLDICPDNGYCMFVDDDELVAPNYISELQSARLQEPDIITFNSLVTMDNWWGVCETKLGHPIEEGTPNGVFKRPPFHICAFKTEYAKQYKFPLTGELSMYGEDWAWAKQLLHHCKSEYHINMILHNYIHSIKISRASV